MRICHFIGTLDPAFGGPPAVAARLASAQAHQKEQVRLVTYANADRQSIISAALREVPFIDAIQVEFLPQHLTEWQRWTGLHIRRRVRELIQESDLIHLHGLWETLLRIAAAEARRADKPYVIRPAGMLDPWSLSQSRWKKRIAMRLGYRNMIKQAKFIHALNRDEADLIGPLGVDCPVKVLPNGVFLEELQPMPDRGCFFNKHPELRNRPYILFMSRLHYKKGLDYLADAFARLAEHDDQTQLVVAGPDDGAGGDFVRHVTRLDLRDRVHLVGPIFGRGKVEMLVDAGCFCLPSRQEGFSMAITEALACGLPAVISDNCHFPEVHESCAGRVVPLDAIAIGDALQDVMSDDALRSRMSRHARQLIQQRYNWHTIAEQTIQCYRDAGVSAGTR